MIVYLYSWCTVDQEFFDGKIFCRLNFCVVLVSLLWPLDEINWLALFVEENILPVYFRCRRWSKKVYLQWKFPNLRYMDGDIPVEYIPVECSLSLRRVILLWSTDILIKVTRLTPNWRHLHPSTYPTHGFCLQGDYEVRRVNRHQSLLVDGILLQSLTNLLLWESCGWGKPWWPGWW